MSHGLYPKKSGPDKAPDERKNSAIRVISDLIHASSNLDVRYDWHEVLEVELHDGRWVKVTLEEIENPTPPDE